MAKITKMPGLAIINGFKGKLDFYVYMGINCVRKWPRSPGHLRTPAEMEHWPAFSWAASNWKNLSPAIIDAYNQLSVGTNMTGKDLFIKGYISPLYLHLD